MAESVKLVDLSHIKLSDYKARYVGCLVLTNDHKILLQQRGHDFVTYPDYLCEFGGHIEEGEEPLQAVIRELKEELGASAQENEIVSLGAITDCYEGTAKFFDHVESISTYPKITDGLRWMLRECQRRGFLIKNR